MEQQFWDYPFERPLDWALESGIRERKFILYQIAVPSKGGKCYTGITDLDLETAVEQHITLAKNEGTSTLYQELRKFSYLCSFSLVDEFSNEVHARLAISEISHNPTSNILYGEEQLTNPEYSISRPRYGQSFLVKDLISEREHNRTERLRRFKERRKTTSFLSEILFRIDGYFARKFSAIPLIEEDAVRLAETVFNDFGIQLEGSSYKRDVRPKFDTNETKKIAPMNPEHSFALNALVSKQRKQIKKSIFLPFERAKQGRAEYRFHELDPYAEARDKVKRRLRRYEELLAVYKELGNEINRERELTDKHEENLKYQRLEKKFYANKKKLLAAEDINEYRESRSPNICFITRKNGIEYSFNWSNNKPEETVFGIKWPICFKAVDVETVFVKGGDTVFSDSSSASSYVKSLVSSGNIESGPRVRFVLPVRSKIPGRKAGYEVFDATGNRIKSKTGFYR